MKRAIVYSAVTVFLVAIVLIALFIVFPAFSGENKKTQKPFYLGVTYCGNSTDYGRNDTAEAMLLIDRVKGYTNLFVLQSGRLQFDPNAMYEICDYAVNSGLDVIVYLSTYDDQTIMSQQQSFIATAKKQWGSQFLGLYYGDEPAGKMLDANQITFRNKSIGENVTWSPYECTIEKADGTTVNYNHRYFNFTPISMTYANGTWITWSNGSLSSPNGTSIDLTGRIQLTIPNGTDHSYPNGTIIGTNYDYFPNGTVTKSYTNYSGNINGSSVYQPATPFVIDKNDAPQVGTYEQAFATLPFKTYDETAVRFVDNRQGIMKWLRNQSVALFTSDYGFYWYDYLGGYDVVFAEFGWNHTTAQDIALVRGAANLANKSWGAIITWKYTEPPYLASGDEIYNQLRMAYEGGAKYAIIFNYPTIEGNQYGVLQDEHFQALERFWNEVAQNPKEINGGVKAEAALVLPKNYGWGMRTSNDTIWGMWPADNKSQQIWTLLQNNLAQYGSRLDIVYDDPAYPVAGKYPNTYYWNQTG